MYFDIFNKYAYVLDEMSNTEQEPEWHSEGNVAIHTKMVVETLYTLEEFKECSEYEQKVLTYAAFFHDYGKIEVTQVIDGRVRSPGHSKMSEKKTRKLLYKNGYDFKFREEVCGLVRQHGFPIHSYHYEDQRTVKISHYINSRLLYILCKADMLGRILQSGTIDETLMNLDYFKEVCIREDCYGKPKEFNSDLQRLKYFEKGIVYEPYQEESSTVYFMCALPGSGKDFYIKNNLKDINHISLDNMRRELKIKHSDKKAQGRIIQAAKKKAKEYLAKKENFIWNATNVTESIRMSLIDMFKEYKATVKIIYIEVPYKELLKQNANRNYAVPEKVIDNLIHKLDMPNETEVEKVEFITY